MTLQQIINSEKDFLTPAEVAGVLGCNPYVISLRAKEGTLPFPFFRSGSRTKIPRLGFIRWMRGELPINYL